MHCGPKIARKPYKNNSKHKTQNQLESHWCCRRCHTQVSNSSKSLQKISWVSGRLQCLILIRELAISEPPLKFSTRDRPSCCRRQTVRSTWIKGPKRLKFQTSFFWRRNSTIHAKVRTRMISLTTLTLSSPDQVSNVNVRALLPAIRHAARGFIWITILLWFKPVSLPRHCKCLLLWKVP